MYAEPKDWILVPSSQDDERVYVTQTAAESIARQWKNSPNAELRDESGNLKALIGRKDYKLKKSGDLQEVVDRRWICNYGVKHKMSKQCDCQDKLGVEWWNLLTFCQKYYKIEHTHQIEDHMRAQFLT